MSNEKNTLIWDLDSGHCASLEDVEWNENRESDFIRIKYYPFNDLPLFNFKTYEYPKPIPRKFTHEILVPSNSGLVGQPKRLLVIFEGGANSLLAKHIGKEQLDQIKKLEEKLNDLQKENSKLRQENLDAKTNVNKAVQTAKALTDKASSTTDTLSMPGFNTFNRPPSSGGFGFN